MEYEVLEFEGNALLFPSPNLGDAKLEAALGEILQSSVMQREGKTFLIKWTGDTRVPRLELGGHQVTYTQHGVVYGDNGTMIGSYERLKDLDGPSRNENAMLIKLWS